MVQDNLNRRSFLGGVAGMAGLGLAVALIGSPDLVSVTQLGARDEDDVDYVRIELAEDSRFELRALVYTASFGLSLPILPLFYVLEVRAPDAWIVVEKIITADETLELSRVPLDPSRRDLGGIDLE